MKYFTFLLVLMLISCGSPKKQENEIGIIYDQVMEIHDEIMPEMGALETQLMKMETVDPSYNKMELGQIIQDLKLASKEMWDWMHEFNHDEKKSFEEQKKYLLNEKKKILQVSLLMKSSIKNSKQFLKEYGKN